MPKLRVPRHLELRDLLFRRWRSAGMKVGDRIESQNEIVSSMGFSLVTVLRTLRDMENEHIIYRQVGRGSFLVRLPWAESYLRIGWFYNRDMVVGGIFSNPLYSHVVAALENTIVSDGHAFVLGSFTTRKLPVELWDRLDAVILFGAASFESPDSLPAISSRVAAMDMLLSQEWIDSYTVDILPAFEGLIHYLSGCMSRILYVDGDMQKGQVRERCERLRQFAERSPHQLEILSVDHDRDEESLPALLSAVAEFRPGIICGFVKEAWGAALKAQYPALQVFPVTAHPNAAGFYVDSRAWARVIADRLYVGLANRSLPVMTLRFPAHFVA